MSGAGGKYAKTFVMGLQNALEYRANFTLSLLSSIFPIAVQVFLWLAVFQSADRSSVFGYTRGELIAYSILAALFGKLAAAGFEHEIAGDIKDGRLSKFVVQPIHYFLFRLCSFLGEKAMHYLVIAVLTAGVVFALRGDIQPEPMRILVCLAALSLSVAINFLIFFSLSMTAFWIQEVWGIYLAFSLLANIAGGGLFPLDMFSDSVQAVLSLLPFKYIVYFPAQLLLGKVPPGDLFASISVQGLWILVLTLVSMGLWRTGLRKYESVGG
ncbi:ABC transporter permease [Paenibacillus sp. S-38]|uniref:ABC transporter permease n=1 Tax=Paenibacillus sp. S-38 TaxID=3416710 RepID=UPI003CEA5208